MTLRRRQFLQFAAAAAAAPAFSRRACALDYPTRPVHLIVGFAAGGPQDIIMRLMCQWLSERLGQSFIVENKPGASGNVGAETVVRAAPDGYTLLSVSSPNAINASLYKNLNFNFIRDIAPVASIMRVPLVMEVNPSRSGQDGSRADRLHQSQSRQDQLRLGRHRHAAARLRRAVQDDDRGRDGAGALSRRGAGAHRSDRRTGAGHDRHLAGLDAAHPLRQSAGVGGHHGDARGRAARSADGRRVPAGLRGDLVVRHRRAEEHAARDHRQAQQGNQRRPRRSENQRAAEGPRRHHHPRHARRLRQAHRRRNREMGQGDRVLGRQSTN